jgi:uncharacterized RDD family membrane protein YckC
MSESVTAVPAPRYAGFWRRLWAFLIDHAIVLLPMVGTLYGVGIVEVLSSDDPIAAASGYVDEAAKLSIGFKPFYLGVLWLYYTLLESSARQATLGKQLLRIKVTTLTGDRIGFWRALGRQLGKIVSTLILGIGFIIAAFTARKQALHDLFARCLVVRV